MVSGSAVQDFWYHPRSINHESRKPLSMPPCNWSRDEVNRLPRDFVKSFDLVKSYFEASPERKEEKLVARVSNK